MSDGRVTIDTRLDSSGVKSGLNGLESTIAPSLKKIGVLVAAAFSVKKLFDFGKEAVSLASDLTEVQNVVDTAFGDMKEKMEEFADSSIEMFGISKLTAKQTGSTFMAMARGMNIAMNNASDMAIALTGLSADMASFYNVSQDVASTALKSIFTGETETLKQFGIVMTDANLQQFAYTQGINKKISAMTQAEKVQLRYNYVMNQTRIVQGDFAKTSDSFANQTRILSERWKEFLSIVGSGLLKVLTPCVKALNQLMAGVLNVANAIAEAFGFDKIEASASNAQTAVTDLGGGFDDNTESVNDNTKAIKNNQNALKKSIAAYDDLKVIQKDTSSDSSGSGGGAGAIASGLGDGLAKFQRESNKNKSVISSLTEPLEKLKELFTELSNSFMQGFTLAIGDDWNSRIASIRSDLSSIKKSFTEIITNTDLTEASNEFLNALAKFYGSSIGTYISIGTSIAANIIGGMKNYLETSAGFITKQLTNILTVNTDSLDKLTQFNVAISDIFKVLETPEAKSFTGNLIGIFSDAFLGIGTVITDFANSFITLIVTPITQNSNKIKTALQNSFSVLSTVLEPIKGTVDSVFSTFTDVYVQKIQPAVQNIADGLSSIFGSVLDTYNRWISPVLTKLADEFSGVWSATLEPLVTNVIKFGGDIAELIGNLWKNILAPLVDFIVNVLGTAIAPVLDVLGTVFIGTFGAIAKAVNVVITALDAVVKSINFFVSGDFVKVLEKVGSTIGDKFKSASSAIKDAFKGIPTWFSDNVWAKIKSVFSNVSTWFKSIFTSAYSGITGAFSNVKTFFSGVVSNIKGAFSTIATWFKTTFTTAWTNVKNVFSKGGKIFTGIKDGILNGLKAVINKLIDGINLVITKPFDGLNKALNKIKSTSILGAKPFGGLPTISTPKIPKLAKGAVIPANKEFLALLGDQKEGTNIETPLKTMIEAFDKAMEKHKMNDENIIIQIDGKEVFRAVKNQNDTYRRMTGRSQLA